MKHAERNYRDAEIFVESVSGDRHIYFTPKKSSSANCTASSNPKKMEQNNPLLADIVELNRKLENPANQRDIALQFYAERLTVAVPGSIPVREQGFIVRISFHPPTSY